MTDLLDGDDGAAAGVTAGARAMGVATFGAGATGAAAATASRKEKAGAEDAAALAGALA